MKGMVKTTMTASFALMLVFIMADRVPAQSKSQTADGQKVAEDTVFFNLPDDRATWPNPEQFPEFPGGESALIEYIINNTIYPQTAIDDSISGKVYTNFVVNIDGSVDNIKIWRGIRCDLDSVCYRVIKEMPAWEPGQVMRKTRKGWYWTKTRISYSIPFTFTLDTLATGRGFIITPKEKSNHSNSSLEK